MLLAGPLDGVGGEQRVPPLIRGHAPNRAQSVPAAVAAPASSRRAPNPSPITPSMCDSTASRSTSTGRSNGRDGQGRSPSREVPSSTVVPVMDLGEGVVGVQVSIGTGPTNGYVRGQRFVRDDDIWVPAGPEETGIVETTAVA